MDQYGTIVNEEAKSLLKNKGGLLMDYGKQKFLEMKKTAEEGNWTWKVAGFVAGLLMIVNSLLSFLSNFFGLSPFRAVLNAYLIVFGIIACLLEFKEKTLTQNYNDIVKREALFLYNPYGRAAFYFFIGVLMAAEGGVIGFFGGIYCSLIGVVIYTSSTKAFAQLAKLRDSIHEKDVEEKFAQFDADHSGFMESCELGNLTAALGASMSIHELESAMFILDKNGDGKISLVEFKKWWCNRDDALV